MPRTVLSRSRSIFPSVKVIYEKIISFAVGEDIANGQPIEPYTEKMNAHGQPIDSYPKKIIWKVVLLTAFQEIVT